MCGSQMTVTRWAAHPTTAAAAGRQCSGVRLVVQLSSHAICRGDADSYLSSHTLPACPMPASTQLLLVLVPYVLGTHCDARTWRREVFACMQRQHWRRRSTPAPSPAAPHPPLTPPLVFCACVFVCLPAGWLLKPLLNPSLYSNPSKPLSLNPVCVCLPAGWLLIRVR